MRSLGRIAAANSSPYEGFLGVGCNAHSCLVVGNYFTKIETGVPIAVTEANGSWGRGSVVADPPNAEPLRRQLSSAYSASCGRTSCTVVGPYASRSGSSWPMAARES